MEGKASLPISPILVNMDHKVSRALDSFALYKEYSRKDVHQVFGDGTKYVDGAGIWGEYGVIKPKIGEEVYILFCLIKPETSGMHLQYIELDGKFHWLSQPSMYPGEKKLEGLITASKGNSMVLLFAKPRSGPTYAYIGKLSFLTVDEGSIRPTIVTWKIQPWPMPEDQMAKFGIK